MKVIKILELNDDEVNIVNNCLKLVEDISDAFSVTELDVYQTLLDVAGYERRLSDNKIDIGDLL